VRFFEPSSLTPPLIDEVIETAGTVGEEVRIPDALSPLELIPLNGRTIQRSWR
jgi:hypothetical protein